MAGYAGGRITRIKIKNFMTYDDVEIFPKSGLNLIVGLNGSGKSSIMCAICLGLAGKPQFTGRTSHLSDFVKHGQQEAEIQIELESLQDRNVTIVRKISGNKCEWFLNKKPVKEAEVSKTVKIFNIDTSNLCQFLPQEKVTEFSRMDKKQRLENMLQAIGEPRLFVLFNELKELYKKCCDLENNIKKSETTKKTSVEKNERISDEVKKQEDRGRLKKKLDELLKIKQIIKYKEAKNEISLLRNERKTHETELSSAAEERDRRLAVETAIRQEYLTEAGNLQNKKKQLENVTNKLHNLSGTAVSFLTEEAETAKIEFRNKMQEKQTQKKRVKDINQQIEGLERLHQEERQKKPTIDAALVENSEKLSEVSQEVNDLYQITEKASLEKNSINYSLKSVQKELDGLKDERNKRLINLKRRDKHTFDAVMWVQENRNKFKSTIYLPMLLEVNVNSEAHSKYVENSIAQRDLFAFLCEDKDDCTRLTDILTKQLKLRVNVVMAPDQPMSHFRSQGLSKEFRSYGLEGFLIDFIIAPEPVMRFLCACYKIHNIPVASKNIDNSKTEIILQKFSLFYAGSVRVSGKRSRYGDHNWSVRSDFIQDRNLLTNYDDKGVKEASQKLQRLECQLRQSTAAHEKLRSNLLEKEKIQDSLRQEKRNLQDSLKQLDKIAKDLAMKKNFRAQMGEVINEEEETEKVMSKVQAIIAKKEKVFNETNKLFKDVFRLQKQAVQLMLRMNCHSKQIKMTKAENEEVMEKVKSLEKTIHSLNKVIEEKTIPAKKLRDEIMMIKISVSQKDLLNSLDDIEDKISHVQAQLNLNEDNEPLIKEYNARKMQIEAIEADINEFEKSLDELKEMMVDKKEEWLGSLERHITNINRKFSAYFKHLSCAGEISLDIPDNQNDFSHYGLQIKLKFHDDQPMTELSTTHHSGGECSVAAIIFILSLQELTEVPFRCIDEINQGMDSIYERKIYKLIADSVGDDRCSQYFLLTPKLLFDLTYPDDVAVHVIYNSGFINWKINIKQILEAAKSA